MYNFLPRVFSSNANTLFEWPSFQFYVFDTDTESSNNLIINLFKITKRKLFENVYIIQCGTRSIKIAHALSEKIRSNVPLLCVCLIYKVRFTITTGKVRLKTILNVILVEFSLQTR